MRVFVACLHLFAASVEQIFSPFLTNVLFLCIIGKKDTKKGETTTAPLCTPVYAPTGEYLLWWDAERIEDKAPSKKLENHKNGERHENC